MGDTKEFQKVFVVEISHSKYGTASFPILRRIVVGVTNSMAAMRVVVRNTNYIKPPHYNVVTVKELANTIDSSAIGVFNFNE